MPRRTHATLTRGRLTSSGHYLPITTRISGKLFDVKLPTNQYDDDTSERDALLAVFEQLRGIRVAVWALVVLVAALLVVVWAR